MLTLSWDLQWKTQPMKYKPVDFRFVQSTFIQNHCFCFYQHPSLRLAWIRECKCMYVCVCVHIQPTYFYMTVVACKVVCMWIRIYSCKNSVIKRGISQSFVHSSALMFYRSFKFFTILTPISNPYRPEDKYINAEKVYICYLTHTLKSSACLRGNEFV